MKMIAYISKNILERNKLLKKCTNILGDIHIDKCNDLSYPSFTLYDDERWKWSSHYIFDKLHMKSGEILTILLLKDDIDYDIIKKNVGCDTLERIDHILTACLSSFSKIHLTINVNSSFQ